MESGNNRIFKIILIVLFLIFLMGNIYFYFIIEKLEAENKEIKTNLSIYNEDLSNMIGTNEQINEDIHFFEKMVVNISVKKQEYFNNIRELEQKILKNETKIKIAYLTFDDGPYNLTDEYLKVLKDNDVRATFFVLGKPSKFVFYKKIINDGHTIGNHTYSHRIRKGIYRSSDAFIKDVVKLENYLYDNFGITTDIVRFPGGSSQAGSLKKTIVDKLHNIGYGYVDWTAQTGDGVSSKIKAYDQFVKTLKGRKIAVVLMHDYSRVTLADLPKIIEYLKSHDYVMLPLFKDSVMIK